MEKSYYLIYKNGLLIYRLNVSPINAINELLEANYRGFSVSILALRFINTVIIYSHH